GLPGANMFGQMTFMLRSSGDPMSLVSAARRAVAEIDPDRPLSNVVTMGRQITSPIPQRREYVVMLGVFALTATLLAAIGIYGVMAYSVTQRTREIGIRMALGASARAVVLIIGRRALVLVMLGLLFGVAGSLTLTRLLTSQLWGVAPTDLATYAVVFGLLLCVSLLACYLPTRRATAVNPTVALRCE
ncbi:MAG: FtsX-like permease family protein, partial [Vicinamibacterales bacterium]